MPAFVFCDLSPEEIANADKILAGKYKGRKLSH